MPSPVQTLPDQASRSPAATPPRAVLFDAYGTLFDVYSVAQLAEELFPGHGQALSVLWRDKQIEYTRLVTTSNHGAHYQPFSALTRAALVFAIKKLVVGPGTTLSEADFLLEHEPAIEMLLAQYQHLDAFPENLAVLATAQGPGHSDRHFEQWRRRHAAGRRGTRPGLTVCSTTSSASTRFANSRPTPRPMRWASRPPALLAPDILFVSCNAWDALGATWYGYTTLWVNRYHLPFEELGTQPTRTGSDLRAVLDFFC